MAFAYRGTFTVTGNTTLLPGGPHTDYPLLVSLTDIAFATQINGGQVINSLSTKPADVVFFSNADFTGQLKFECVFWSDVNGQIIYIVKIPSLTAGMVFYCGIGDASITTFQGDSENAWNSGFKAVTHFADLLDSTANNFDGTNNGMTTVSGPLVQGWASNGTLQNAYISGSDTIVTGQALTISAFVKVTSTNNGRGLFGKWNTSAFDWMFYGSNGGNLFLFVVTANGTVSIDSGVAYQDTNWDHLAATYDGSNIRFFINGVETSNSPTAQTGNLQNSASSRVGWSDYLQDTQQQATAKYAETRVSAAVRSADWIKIDYNSINDPATFVSAAFAAVGGQPTPIFLGPLRSNLTWR